MKQRPYGSTRRRPSAVQRGRHDRIQTLCRLITKYGYSKLDCIRYAESKWGISRVTSSAYANEAAGLVARMK